MSFFSCLMWKLHFCLSCMVAAIFLFLCALASAAFMVCIFMWHQFCVRCRIIVFAKSSPPPMIITPNMMGVSSTPVIVRLVTARLSMNTLAIRSAF